MDKKMLTIILAIALLGCFFLPYLKFGSAGSASGFEIVTAEDGRGGDIDVILMKYIWVLIPISAIMLLIGALNNGNYFLGRGIWAWLPLLTLLYFVVRLFLEARKGEGSFEIGELAEVFGVGFWATLVVSLVLAIYNPRSKG